MSSCAFGMADRAGRAGWADASELMQTANGDTRVARIMAGGGGIGGNAIGDGVGVRRIMAGVGRWHRS